MDNSSVSDHNQECRGHSHSHSHRALRIVGLTIAGVIFAALFALVFGFLVKWLWNELMPVIFGVKQITYWQAFGIIVLAKLLFGCFGAHHRGHHRFHKRHDSHDRIRRYMWRCGDNDEEDELWKPKGSHKNWKYYDQYWKEEGKAAFEAYIDKIKPEKEEEK
jgi:hypothetical protein